MLDGVERRARKAGVTVETRLCAQNSLRLEDRAGNVDFALAFALAHEVPDPERLFSEIFECLAPDGKLLLAEPRGHISEKEFAATIERAEQQGLKVVERPAIPRSRAVLMCKF